MRRILPQGEKVMLMAMEEMSKLGVQKKSRMANSRNLVPNLPLLLVRHHYLHRQRTTMYHR
jgi:hypothetical protein